MTADELLQAIAFGREQRGIEFKGPGKRTTRDFCGKVIRAVLAMANKVDGGVVILGVTDGEDGLVPIGLSDDELSTWSYDDFASSVSNYADPYVEFSVDVVALDGKKFVVLEVSQFAELPVICKRDCPGVLRNGDIVNCCG